VPTSITSGGPVPRSYQAILVPADRGDVDLGAERLRRARTATGKEDHEAEADRQTHLHRRSA